MIVIRSPVMLHQHRLAHLAAATLAGLVGMVAGACAERKSEVDFSDYLEEGCVTMCTNTRACGIEGADKPTHVCIDDCINSDQWITLNQCTSAELKFTHCFGTMTCEEMETYNAWVFGDDSSTDFPCWLALVDTYNCDPNEPFEAP